MKIKLVFAGSAVVAKINLTKQHHQRNSDTFEGHSGE